MIEDISSKKTKLEALNLLKEGFKDETEQLFKNYLFSNENKNIKRLGVLFKYEDEAVGVLLLFEKERIFKGNCYRYINFSSWYFKKQYRVIRIALMPCLILV